MTYQVQVKGRDGAIVLPDWTPAPCWVTGHEELASTKFSLKEAAAFARDHVEPHCAYAIRILDEDGSAFFFREQQPESPDPPPEDDEP